MAKPLRYGPTIGVRLPIEIHDAVIEMAGPDGPGPWIRDLVVDYVPTCAGHEPTKHDPFIEPEKASAEDQARACQHPQAKRRASGVKVCPSCGATQTGTGPWSQP